MALSMPRQFPADPVTFLYVTTGPTTRVCLLRAHGLESDGFSLEDVTTLVTDAAAAAGLVEELNRAAWTGRSVALEQQLRDLADEVAHDCRAALATCPPPWLFASSGTGVPLSVVGRAWFDEPEQVTEHFLSAMEVGLQVVVENDLASTGVVYKATLLSGDVLLDPHEVARWAPRVPWNLLERHYPGYDELEASFNDPRWGSHWSRAYWLLVREPQAPQSAMVHVVVEHYDAPVEDDLANRSYTMGFERSDDLDDRTDHRYFTVRNRYVLFMSLWNIVVDLDELLQDWPDANSDVLEDMPPFVRRLPRPWWAAMFRSAVRLCEAARTGTWTDLVPRTPAEEALLFLSTSATYIERATRTATELEQSVDFAALPVDGFDGGYEAMLLGLLGRPRIAAVWAGDRPGLEDPAHPHNIKLRLGDYRPQAWHRPLNR